MVQSLPGTAGRSHSTRAIASCASRGIHGGRIVASHKTSRQKRYYSRGSPSPTMPHVAMAPKPPVWFRLATCAWRTNVQLHRATPAASCVAWSPIALVRRSAQKLCPSPLFKRRTSQLQAVFRLLAKSLLSAGVAGGQTYRATGMDRSWEATPSRNLLASFPFATADRCGRAQRKPFRPCGLFWTCYETHLQSGC